jgi:hypothetical protein
MCRSTGHTVRRMWLAWGVEREEGTKGKRKSKFCLSESVVVQSYR